MIERRAKKLIALGYFSKYPWNGLPERRRAPKLSLARNFNFSEDDKQR